MLKCTNCGAENQDAARFCYACGTALEAPQPQAEPAQPEQPTAYQQPQQDYVPPQQNYAQQGPYHQPYTPEQPTYQQPYGQGAPNGPAPIKNWLVANIITGVLSLLCCSCIGIVTGIIGIIFSTQVNTKLGAGDFTGAESASRTAKVMFIVTLVLLILGILIGIIYLISFGVSGLRSLPYMDYMEEFM